MRKPATTRAPAPKPSRHLRPSDLRATVNLAVGATHGVTRMAEGVHQAVWGSLGVPGGTQPGQTRGLTGFVYRAVHGVTTLVGHALEAAFTRLEPMLESLVDAPPETPEREAVLAALNGVLGDRLAQQHNPLATPMTLRLNGQALNWQTPIATPSTALRGQVLILIHGLCMNDLQWRTQSNSPDALAHDHGQMLAQALGYTPIYVRYNTGLHTSQNGAEFSNLLEQLVTHWPAPVEEISVVAHSMGGLVTRSAVHQATQKATAQFGKSGEFGKTGTSGKAVLRWPSLLKNIVFLGTPHHGAPLERAGNWVDVLLGSTRYSKPFARLAQLRSAGITDLRYGHVLDGDWQGHDRFRKKPDSRVHVPLPESVACFTVAATTAAKQGSVTDWLIGDGLVPLHSALGLHDDPQRSLHFAKKSQLIAYRTNHLQLLSSQEVAQQMVAWLGR